MSPERWRFLKCTNDVSRKLPFIWCYVFLEQIGWCWLPQQTWGNKDYTRKCKGWIMEISLSFHMVVCLKLTGVLICLADRREQVLWKVRDQARIKLEWKREQLHITLCWPLHWGHWYCQPRSVQFPALKSTWTRRDDLNDRSWERCPHEIFDLSEYNDIWCLIVQKSPLIDSGVFL